MKKNIFICIFLFLISFITLYPLREMFFYRDDFSLLMKLQTGKSFLYPYQHMTTFYKPLYNIFSLNAGCYFSLGLIIFSISTISVFMLLRKIVSLPIAFTASLLYASGLVALENMVYMLYVVAIPTFITIFTFSLFLFTHYIQARKKILLFSSVILYIIILELFSHRAHLTYPYYFLIDFIFFFKKNEKKQFLKRQSIFFLLYFLWYLFPIDLILSAQNPKPLSQFDFASIPSIIFSSNIKNVFINLTNLFSQPIEILLSHPLPLSEIHKILIGSFLTIFSVIIIIKTWKKQNILSRVLLFSTTTLYINLFAYLVFNPGFQIEGISRYNFLSAISFPIYLASLIFISKKMISLKAVYFAFFSVFIFFIGASFISTHIYLGRFNKIRSAPTKKFYSDLKREMPDIPRNTLIYLDRKPTAVLPFDPAEFIRVGRLPTEAAFATVYKVPIENITFTDSFSDVEKKIKENPKLLNTTYSFYIDENGLTNTTYILRRTIYKQETYSVPASSWISKTGESLRRTCIGKYSVGAPHTFMAENLSLNSITPTMLNFTIQIDPIDLSAITFPYYYRADALSDNNSEEVLNQLCKDLPASQLSKPNTLDKFIEIASFIIRQKELSKNINVSSSLSLNENPSSNLFDNDDRTVWTPDITDWSNNKKASIYIQYPFPLALNRLLLIPTNYLRLPTKFTIFTIDEGNKRKEIKSVTNASTEEGKIFEVYFPTITTSSLEIEIYDTNTHLAPQISEMTFVEEKWKDINISEVNWLSYNPFSYLATAEIAGTAKNFFTPFARLSVFWEKDKDSSFDQNNFVSLPVIADGTPHTYSIKIPAGGKKLEKIKIGGLPFPAKITLYDEKK